MLGLRESVVVAMADGYAHAAGPDHPKLPGVELGGIDFGALATGMGCRARLVEQPDEFKPALTAALDDDRPTVVHVRVDPNPIVRY